MFITLHFSGLFKVGRWTAIDKSTDDEIVSSLKSKFPQYCLLSRADSTRKKYEYAFKAFCKWSDLHKLPYLPATDISVSLYLIHVSEMSKSSSTINDIVYSVSWAHRLAGLTDPCKSDLVNLVREGSHRKVGHLVTKKEPVTPEILSKIVHIYGNENCDLKNVRIATIFLLCYSGFLRFSELANLRSSDIVLFTSHVKLFLFKSKTDIYREGRDVVIARTGSVTCPVNMLERYLKLADIQKTSREFIFRPLYLCKSENTFKLRPTGQLTYTRAREIFISALQSIGLDHKKFGLHSLRSGGATAAAAAGVDNRLFKKHGRWKTDTAKDGYVKESLADRLHVSNNIGI